MCRLIRKVWETWFTQLKKKLQVMKPVIKNTKGGKPPVEIRIISPNTMEKTSDAKTGCTKNQSGPSTVCLYVARKSLLVRRKKRSR